MTRVNWCKLIVVAAMFGCSSASADTATVPNVFLDDTPALADEVNQNFNALTTVINANISTVTVFSLADLQQQTFQDPGVVLVEFLFNKRSASSHVLVLYEDSLRADGKPCAVGVFVDGLNSQGAEDPALAPPAIQTETQELISLLSMGVFTGLEAGTRTLELITNTVDAECTRGEKLLGGAGQITIIETPQL